ncbi:MAG: anti-sigma factor [Chloroflexota bacterium]
MSHVVDDLELHALGALPEAEAARVARHLDGCEPCRAEARQLEEVVAALPDALPARVPPAGLRDRILAAGAAELERAPARAAPRRTIRVTRAFALAAGFALLIGLDAFALARLGDLQAERERYAAMAERFSRGGRWWYMAGDAEFAGSGGTLVVPRSDQRPFVLFHDLRQLPEGSLYALWLVSPEGQWVRGPSFRADGRELQIVEVGSDLAGFERCAVTVEPSAAGKRTGPIVMQSRISPP